MLNIREDFHIHCNYNDHSSIDLTIDNVIKKAKEMNLQTIAFTEHVRKSSDWTEKYLDEISYFKSKNGFNILSGFEAKILADGNIDCPEPYLNDKYFIIASFHTKYSRQKSMVWCTAKS